MDMGQLHTKLIKTGKTALFLGLTLALFLRINSILSWKDTAGDYLSATDSFYRMEKNSAEVLFLGSSHCYCSVNTAKLWSDYGIPAGSLSISGQDIVSSYFCLKEALKTQHPRVVCLDFFAVAIEGYEDTGNYYRNTLSLRPSRNSFEAARAITLADAQERYSLKDTLLRLPIYHTRYRELTRLDFARSDAVYLGYTCIFERSDISWKDGGLKPYQGDETTPIPARNEEYLLKIVELAREADVRLCLFLAPFAAGEDWQKQYAYTADLMEKHDVPVINFIQLHEELGLDENNDFCDWAHTNYWGAEKVTDYLGRYLTEHYELEIPAPEERQAERYAVWNANAEARAHECANYVLPNNQYLPLYLARLRELASLPDYTIVITASGSYLCEELDVTDSLAPLIPADDFLAGPCTWVLEDGALRRIPHTAPYCVRMDLGGNGLAVSGEQGTDHILLDFEDLCRVTDGINIVVYDRLFEKVTDAVGFHAGQLYDAVR